jgi:two-component system CheB/CheR fusion protein
MTMDEARMPVEPEGADTQLVVIGASAGGVDALLGLIERLPSDFPAPIVIAQHLDPRLPSQLNELLTARTALPVRTVTGQETLQPGTVYVVPADRDVEISDHHVSVDPATVSRAKPSVDRLLTTAAHVFREGLFAVILTGTGADGAAGAQAVKAYGGTVVVENPATARFPGMPEAVPAAAIDIVADLEAIGPLLSELLAGTYGQPLTREGDELPSFLERIRGRTGLDFAAYKRDTIVRRLQRRMAAVGVQTLPDYRRYVDRHPDEARQLAASFLIKVTEFFRDPDLFDTLRDNVLPQLIADARERGELRVWSAGCATGEEAYSLAMLLTDLLGDEVDTLPVRIFATDIAADALDLARRGIYPESALKELPAALIARHFTPVDGVYQVHRRVRELIVFGEHDLGQRAPFPRIDLVLCRNVLIYFTADLQRRALQRFAFALRPGGYLVLGKSETVSPLPAFFALEESRLKLFRRIGSSAPMPESERFGDLEFHLDRRQPPRSPRRGLAPASAGAISESSLVPLARNPLAELSVGVITVDRDYDIRAINGAARSLLGLHGTSIGADLIHTLQPALAILLRTALDAAWRGETTAETYSAPRDVVDDVSRDLRITCSPVRHDAAEEVVETVLVEVVDVSRVLAPGRALETELAQTRAERDQLREQMAAVIPEVRLLRGSNQQMVGEQERLRFENEQLQLGTEEAQAATEEVETLNEELQATNEELETLNEELQATVEELRATNHELHVRTSELELMATSLDEQRRAGEVEHARLAAILANLADAVLVVDMQGEAILTNAAYDRLFGAMAGFTPQDEAGQPLSPEEWPQQRAARGESFTQAFTLPGQDGTRRWFESNAQPVPGSDGASWGVLVIRDITDRSLRRQQEQFLAMAAHELRTPLTALSGRLQLLIRRLAQSDAEERARQEAAHALEQARRLETHIHELLDATRVQIGQLSLNRAPLDLVVLVQEVASLARPLAEGRTIDVAVPDQPVMVDGDAHRLEQVLLNLLTNAVTHAPGTERIAVRLSSESSVVSRQSSNTTHGRSLGTRLTTPDHPVAMIEVEDTGPGIAEEDLPHVFTRFFQTGSTRTARSGLGLGLYIAQEIITAHGGTITARSTVGEGTTFTVRLPARADEVGKSGVGKSASGETVLTD